MPTVHGGYLISAPDPRDPLFGKCPMPPLDDSEGCDAGDVSNASERDSAAQE